MEKRTHLFPYFFKAEYEADLNELLFAEKNGEQIPSRDDYGFLLVPQLTEVDDGADPLPAVRIGDGELEQLKQVVKEMVRTVYERTGVESWDKLSHFQRNMLCENLTDDFRYILQAKDNWKAEQLFRLRYETDIQSIMRESLEEPKSLKFVQPQSGPYPPKKRLVLRLMFVCAMPHKQI